MLHLMSSLGPELLLSMRDPLQGSVSSRPPAPSSGQPGAPTRAARHTGSTLNGLKHVVQAEPDVCVILTPPLAVTRSSNCQKNAAVIHLVGRVIPVAPGFVDIRSLSLTPG